MKFYTKTIWKDGSSTRIVNLFGFKIAVGFCGNCIWPILHIKSFIDRVNLLSLVLRFNVRDEVTVYVRRSGRIDWNSTWIARRFGVAMEQDFGTIYSYEGILGRHVDI